MNFKGIFHYVVYLQIYYLQWNMKKIIVEVLFTL